MITDLQKYIETADVHTASSEYAGRFSGATGCWFLDVQEKILKRLLADQGGKTVLDVGGGHGQIAAPLSKAGFDVTVLASSEDATNALQPLISSKSCKVQIGSILKIPFPDKSFDIVTCFRLVPHCDLWPNLIKELCRVSRGVVIVDYPTIQSVNFLSSMLFDLKKKAEGNTRNFLLFSHHEIENAFHESEFKVESRVGEFFFPMVVHRLLKNPLISKALEFLPKCLGITYLFGSPVIVRAISSKTSKI